MGYRINSKSILWQESKIYKYRELQKTMSLLISLLPSSNFVSSSLSPIAFAAVVICLTSSSSRRSVRIVVPSKVPVSFCTSTNFTPLHHAKTASILKEEKWRVRKQGRVHRFTTKSTKMKVELREYGRISSSSATTGAN